MKMHGILSAVGENNRFRPPVFSDMFYPPTFSASVNRRAALGDSVDICQESFHYVQFVYIINQRSFVGSIV